MTLKLAGKSTHLDSIIEPLDSITEETYEVESCKKAIKLNLPIQVGFFVYQYAKLHMLHVYYDFVDKYLDHADFQMCEMDTDSAYITISRESVAFSQTRTELNSTKINVTGFQEPIRLNIKPMIRESQGYLKSNGKDKGSWVCVLRLITVLARKISLVVMVSTRNAMTSPKTSTFKFC